MITYFKGNEKMIKLYLNNGGDVSLFDDVKVIKYASTNIYSEYANSSSTSFDAKIHYGMMLVFNLKNICNKKFKGYPAQKQKELVIELINRYNDLLQSFEDGI